MEQEVEEGDLVYFVNDFTGIRKYCIVQWIENGVYVWGCWKSKRSDAIKNARNPNTGFMHKDRVIIHKATDPDSESEKYKELFV